MNDLNSVYLVGRLTDDPKISKMDKGGVRLSYILANNQFHFNEEKKDYIRNTNFFKIITFTEEENPIYKYLKKGLRIGINGHLKTSHYLSKTGKQMISINIISYTVQILEPASQRIDSQSA